MIRRRACSHALQYTPQSSLTQCPRRSCFNPLPRNEVPVRSRDNHNCAHQPKDNQRILHWQPLAMSSYKGGAPEVVHCVETRTKIKEVEELELDPGTNDDNRVKPVEETPTFQLGPKEGQVTQLGNQLPNDNLAEYNRLSRSTWTYLHGL